MTMRRQKFLLFRVYQFQDTQAYGELYDLYFVKISRYIYFKMPRGGEADEITADVFLRGWEYATSSKVDNPSALFYKIARNLIADFYRKRKEELSLDDVGDQASEERLVKDVSVKLESEDLIFKMRLLKDEYREVIVMKFLDEMSVREISDALDKTPNNIRVTLHRAKKALKKLTKE